MLKAFIHRWLRAVSGSSGSRNEKIRVGLKLQQITPEDVEYVIDLGKRIFMKSKYFFDFKENVTVSIYTDSEGKNWAMGFSPTNINGKQKMTESDCSKWTMTM